ncbi:hypothetical protein DFA_00685 [Cavenderia fasciculata]|uniref:Uncharacterized protein n=1 Tax=Cavenderia fasciculata TaxID=261658 RepID=F4PT84_CACFS|nr:uncharacterized protein DFA_00685 [Cavenderia fasciculata]EGG20820.1 hypothetical protein DFA_00685 [Cavenderia fasciculata]|eukprot:XP_004358670.1 hypothetical protein DFA_00685 [Cavenderia fasciculata]
MEGSSSYIKKNSDAPCQSQRGGCKERGLWLVDFDVSVSNPINQIMNDYELILYFKYNNNNVKIGLVQESKAIKNE